LEGLDLARKKMNIMRIVRVVQEFEKLKHILLDAKQRALFDYIPPPILKYSKGGSNGEKRQSRDSILVSASKEFDPNSEIQDKYQDVDSMTQLYEHYRNVKLKNDPLNQKLVNMLGYRLLSIFRHIDAEGYGESITSEKQQEQNLMVIIRIQRLFRRWKMRRRMTEIVTRNRLPDDSHDDKGVSPATQAKLRALKYNDDDNSILGKDVSGK